MVFVYNTRTKDKSQSHFQIAKYRIAQQPLTPQVLVEALKNSDFVINANPTDMPKDGELHQRYKQQLPRGVSEEEFNNIGKFKSTHLHTIAIDLDPINESKTDHIGYNEDYTPIDLQLVANTLSKHFGPVVVHQSQNTRLGRMYLMSTDSVAASHWRDLIVSILYTEMGLTFVESFANRTMVKKHELIDVGVLFGAKKVVTYSHKKNYYIDIINPEAKIKRVSGMKASNPMMKGIPIIKWYTPAAEGFVKELAEAEAKKVGLTVKQLYAMRAQDIINWNEDVVPTGKTEADAISIIEAVKVDGNYGRPGEYSNHSELYIRNGLIFDYGHGKEGTQLSIQYPDKITHHNEHTIEGKYKEATPRTTYFTFICSPTGSGKTHENRSSSNTIILVPTRALGTKLGNDEGFIYIPAGEDLPLDVIDEDTIRDTLVLTYDKFSGHNQELFKNSNIVIDEAPRLFKDSNDEFSGARERLIRELCIPQAYSSVTFISADVGFHRLFELYALDYTQTTSHIYTSEYFEPKITISNALPKGFNMNRRVGIYCNSISKAEAYSKVFNALLITGEERSPNKPEDIDLNPDRNFVFTSVMREGYSINSNVDALVIDARANQSSPTGAVHAIQALSRPRNNKNLRVYIIHTLNTNKAKIYSLEGAEAVARTLIDTAQTDLDVEGGLISPVYKDIRQAISRHDDEDTMYEWRINKAILVGAYLKATAKAEYGNVYTFRTSLRYECTINMKHLKPSESLAIPLEKNPKVKETTWAGVIKAVMDMEESNKKATAMSRIDRLIEANDLSDEGKAELFHSPKLYKQYTIKPNQLLLLIHLNILSSEPFGIREMSSRTNKLLSDKVWAKTNRGSRKHTLKECFGILTTRGIGYKFVTKDGAELKPVTKKEKGAPISHYIAEGNPKKFTVVDQLGFKHPSGCLIEVENVLANMNRLKDKR